MQAGDQSKQDEIAQFLAEEDAAERRKAEPPPEEAVRDLALWRSPRAGALNPTRQDNPLWHWMVRTRWSAYGANELLRGPSPFAQGPMWCFARYGKSETVLADGRVVHIGGEHEDSCDPDFFIYNDDTGDCYIFPYASEFLTDGCQDCVSGPATCEGSTSSFSNITCKQLSLCRFTDLVCWMPGTCSSGTEIATFGVDNSDQCLQECRSEPDCDWFSYDTSNNLCYLYTGECNPAASECDTCYSSQKYCYRRLKSKATLFPPV